MPDPQTTRPDVLPFPKGALDDWQGNIAKAREVRKKVERWWEANLKKYAPMPTDDPEQYGEEINTNRDFTLVERKKADLFYQRPDVTPIASPLFVGQEAKLDTHKAILDEKLGPNEINALDLCHRVLFDILCTSGMGWTVMGYESATVPVQETQQAPGGQQPGAVLGLQDIPQTVNVTVDVPVFERCFWEYLSPKQGLIPADARTTDTDAWPWIGYEFEMPLRVAKRKGWVDDRFAGGMTSPELHFDHGLNTTGDEVVRGQVIYYKSALYRDDRPHPQHQTLLVLIDGKDEPAEHKDSPYQDLDGQGRLTPDSLLGFPIHPCAIRVLTDTSYVPSDCTISRPLVNELNKFREQMVEQRANTLIRYTYNVDVLPKDALEKIVTSPLGGFIGVPGEAFVGDGAIKEVPHGTFPRENFTFNDYLDNDLARTHAIDAEQSGAGARGEQSATESQIKQNNVNARLGLERGRFLTWYLRGYTKYSQIAMRLLPIEDAAKIVGPQAAQEWDAWRKTVPATLAFTALPDSAQRTDLAVDRKRAMDEYTYFANDPHIDRVALLKALLPKLRYPQSVIVAQPPQKGPEPTKPNFSFKGEDLNPLAPQFAIVKEILAQCGVQISDQAVQAAQEQGQNALLAAHVDAAGKAGGGSTGGMSGAPAAAGIAGHQPPNTQHGGKVAQLESLSKHSNALTGGMQGTGAPAPLGPGGGVQ